MRGGHLRQSRVCFVLAARQTRGDMARQMVDRAADLAVGSHELEHLGASRLDSEVNRRATILAWAVDIIRPKGRESG